MIRTPSAGLAAYQTFQGQRHGPWNLGEMPTVCRHLERLDSLGIRLVHGARRSPISALAGSSMFSVCQGLECSADHVMAIIGALADTPSVPLEKGQTVEVDIRDLVALTRRGASFDVSALESDLPKILHVARTVQSAKAVALPPDSAIQFTQYGNTYDLRTAPFTDLMQMLPVYLSKLPEKEESKGISMKIGIQDVPGILADMPTLMPEARGNIKLGAVIKRWVEANLS